MGLLPKFKKQALAASGDKHQQFLIQAIRVLLVCIRQTDHLPPEMEDSRLTKVLNQFTEHVGKEQAVPLLQRSLAQCRGAILSHNQLEKHFLKKRESELREIITVLVRNFTVFNEETNGNIGEFERCTEQLELARNLDDLTALRKVLSEQVDTMKDHVVRQREQQSLMVQQMNEQIEVLNSNLTKSEKAALTDTLTGSGNRRGLDLALKERIDTALVDQSKFSVLIWDVDNFKKMNDTYGHLVGDGVLKTLVKQCYRMVRGGDYVGRYGGEEFVIILDGADIKMAARRGREIVKSIAALDIMLQGATKPICLRATVSIGAAQFKPGDTSESLLERADKAMYKAKKTGKNRLELNH